MVRRPRLTTSQMGCLVAVAFVLLRPAQASAEWQLKPFLGLTAGGGTTFFDSEQAAGRPNVVVGATGVLLGEVIGIDGDISFSPGFFQSGDRPMPLVSRSSVTTFTGNIVVALPRRMTEYTLRPYFVGGGGLMHVDIEDVSGIFPQASNLGTVDIGGGVTGFLTDRVGISWEVRRFSSARGKPNLTGDPEQLSFWRANMSLAVRMTRRTR